jgi:hypothetical protein
MNIIIVLRFDTPFPKKAVQRYDKKIKNMTFEERIFGRNLRMFGTSAFRLWDVPPFRGANCSEILGAEDYFCDGNGVRMAFSELFLSAILTFLCNKLSPKKQITNFETNLGVIQL